jgi:hypothetical protein
LSKAIIAKKIESGLTVGALRGRILAILAWSSAGHASINLSVFIVSIFTNGDTLIIVGVKEHVF